jgi:hypothetical protein
VSIRLYAGNPEYPSGTRRTFICMGTCSDNLDGAGNQQERLVELGGWVVGFVDGEGCFSIGFVRQPDRAGRVGYRTGYQVIHQFVVTQVRRARPRWESSKSPSVSVASIATVVMTTIARISCSFASAGVMTYLK